MSGSSIGAAEPPTRQEGAAQVAGALAQRVIDVCDDALARLPVGPTRTAVEAVRVKLYEPLRIAVIGGVSAGKSTLVNALLGQRVAAVDAGECTRVVTWYRFGHPERVELALTDGTVRSLPFGPDGPPAELGVPVESVERLTVWLSNAALHGRCIIDTPGLYAGTSQNASATTAFLGLEAGSHEGRASAAAVAQADALLFLMPQLRRVDADVLDAVRALYAGTGLSAANVVGLLSRVDELSPEGDPLTVAAPIAARTARHLREVVGEVLPVVGKLAETARTDSFTEHDARAIAAIADLDPLDREDALVSAADLLHGTAVPLPSAQRRRLLDLLGLAGVRLAVEAAARGEQGATAMLSRLDVLSGVPALEATIRSRFTDHADGLKAHLAVCDLQRVAYRDDEPATAEVRRGLRAAVEELELDPAMYHLRALEAARAVAVGELRLPVELLDDLELVQASAVPGSVEPPALLDAARRWGRWERDPRRDPAQARLARVTREAFELAWYRATEDRATEAAP